MLVWLPERPVPQTVEKPLIHPYLHGWFGHGNRRVIDHLLVTLKPNTVIELGSWYGKSADYIINHRHSPNRLFCVDLWSEQDILDNIQVIKPHHILRHQGEKQPVVQTT